jgi:predicted transcriptional regulator
MTNGRINVIVIIIQNKTNGEFRKEKIMATVNFTTNGFEYYLHSEHYEALFSEEKEQSLIRMYSCKVRKRRKTV